MTWKVFFPEDSETISEARELHPPSWIHIWDAEDAAKFACEYDWSRRDG
jgi:hypothetical protein